MPSVDTAKLLLGSLAGPIEGGKPLVVLGKQQEIALAWAAGSVHPFQPLETEYMREAWAAIRKTKSMQERQEAESGALSRFFFESTFEARQLAQMDRRNLQSLRGPLGWARLQASAAANGVEGAFEKACQYALQTLEWCSSVGKLVPDAIDAEQSKCLLAIATQISALKQDHPSEEDLKKSIALAADVMRRRSSIGMRYHIDRFFLFRLFVAYDVYSTDAVPLSLRSDYSKILTKQIHMSVAGVEEYMRACMADLRQMVIDTGGENARFFVKGSRALVAASGDKTLSLSDWDTQIVINPYLPAERWYALFQVIHNETLKCLARYSVGFTMLVRESQKYLDENNKDFSDVEEVIRNAVNYREKQKAALETPPDQRTPLQIYLVWLLWKERYELTSELKKKTTRQGGSKAELIDISIPRPDTIEAMEQWNHLIPVMSDEGPDSIQIPPLSYYIDEYILMLREVFAGVSPSVPKSPERVRRLGRMLNLVVAKGASDTWPERITVLKRQGLAWSADFVASQGSGWAKTLLLEVFEQFGASYIPLYSDLASIVDKAIKRRFSAGAPPFPEDLQRAISKWKENGGEWTEDDDALAQYIGNAQAVSSDLAETCKWIEAFQTEHREKADQIVRAICGEAPKSDIEAAERPIQTLVTESYAAWLQGDFVKYAWRDEYEPMLCATIRVYRKGPKPSPGIVWRILKASVQQLSLPDIIIDDLPENAGFQVRVRGDGGLHPIENPTIVRVLLALPNEPWRTTGAGRWPRASYIWGFPVLGLADLVRSYRYRASCTQEFGLQQRLKKTADYLTDILVGAEEIPAHVD